MVGMGTSSQLCPIENAEIDVTGCRNPPCHMKDPVGQQFSTRKSRCTFVHPHHLYPAASQACPSWRPVENLENKNEHLFSRVMKGWLVLVVDVEVRAVKKGVHIWPSHQCALWVIWIVTAPSGRRGSRKLWPRRSACSFTP